MAEQTGVPYDRGWAWMIVVGYFFSSFIMLGVAKSYGILMKPLMDEFNVDITIASLGNAVMAGIYTLGAPVCVALGQHFTERSVVIFGAVFACVFISLCYFKIGIWYLIWMYGIGTVFWWCAIHTTLYGFFGGAYVALNSIVLIDMVGLEIMPKAIGVIVLIQGLGAAIGQPVEGAIKGASGSFSLLNYINSSLMIIGGFFMFLYPFIRDHAKKSKNKNDVELEEEDQA